MARQPISKSWGGQANVGLSLLLRSREGSGDKLLLKVCTDSWSGSQQKFEFHKKWGDKQKRNSSRQVGGTHGVDQPEPN